MLTVESGNNCGLLQASFIPCLVRHPLFNIPICSNASYHISHHLSRSIGDEGVWGLDSVRKK